MKTNTMIIVGVGALLLGAAYVMSRKPQAVAARSANGYATTSDGYTVDAAGNWWSGGQIIYKAPPKVWST